MILFKKKTFQLFYFLSWFSLCFRGYFFQKIIGLSTSSSQMFFLKLLMTPTVPLFQIFNTRKPPFLHTPGISEIPQAWTEVLSYTLQQSLKKKDEKYIPMCEKDKCAPLIANMKSQSRQKDAWNIMDTERTKYSWVQLKLDTSNR